MKQAANQAERQKLIGPAGAYEREKVPGTFEPLARFLLAWVAVPPGARVLDLACGTGIVARLVAPQVGPEGRVVGVDISRQMLRVARSVTPEDVAVTYCAGDAGELPLEDESFDLVLCQQGFQFFPDKPRALREMHRVLAPGGRLALTVWRAVSAEHQPYQWAKAAALSRHVGPEAGEKQRRLAHFFNGDGGQLRTLIQEAGFQSVDVRDEVFTSQKGLPEEFVAEEDYADLSPPVRAAVVQSIRAAMGPFKNDQGTAVPYGFHLALATK